MRTPLSAKHGALGARMIVFHGWEMPMEYAGILPEHRAVRTKVGMFDLCHMGRIIVSGPGRAAFLDGLVTRAVADLKPGAARYSLLCNEAAGVLEDLLVYADDDVHMVVCNASNREAVLKWLAQHAQSGVTVEDKSLEIGMLAVQGPAAQVVLGPFVDVDLASLKRYRFAHVVICDERATLSRTGYTGEDGFEIYLEHDAIAAVWDALLKAGVPPVGLGARDTLRLEAGMCLYGHELTPDINPFEADLAWAVTLDSRNFVGSDALRRLSAAPPARKRIGLVAAGGRLPREGCRVLSAGRDVGFVTSGTFSPTLEKNIAMAYVASACAAPGTPLEIDIRGAREPAHVVALPFYTAPRR
jgi:aminomethyltransferase